MCYRDSFSSTSQGDGRVRVLKQKDKEKISIVDRYVRVGIRPQIQKKKQPRKERCASSAMTASRQRSWKLRAGYGGKTIPLSSPIVTALINLRLGLLLWRPMAMLCCRCRCQPPQLLLLARSTLGRSTTWAWIRIPSR